MFRMINRSLLDRILAKHDYSIAEKVIVKEFIERNNIAFQDNPILATYLKDFDPSNYDLEISNFSDVRELTSWLEILIPQNDQRINGAYFSPSYIVDFIINELEPKFY
jgi:adenine-specific DNA-methyltransferase